MRIAGVIPCSFVDGPGCRYTLFTQGCEHRCEGCQNPQTWDLEGGYEHSIDEIIADIEKEKHIKKVTISGGDPLYQESELTVLCKVLKSKGYDIWVYTGFEWEDVKDLEVMKYIDVLCDGEFVYSEKTLDLRFRGSRNQRLIKVPESLESGEIVEY